MSSSQTTLLRPGAVGAARPRVDGRAKVTGDAAYPSDVPIADVAYAVLVTSPVARGRIDGFRLDEAQAVPGVIEIFTHRNIGRFGSPPSPGGAPGGVTTTLESDRIWHDGQIVATVVAESYEAAREAAYRVTIDYAAEVPASTFDDPGVSEQAVAQVEDGHEDPHVGDVEAGLAQSAVIVEADYATPTQHHNAMELFDTTCLWAGDKLVIHEPSQFVHGLRGAVARQLGIPIDRVEVESRFVGGAFGSRGGATSRTVLIALAAKHLNRPVRLVATRAQGFTIATYRAETRHRVKLGADRDGCLLALVHEGREITSRPSGYNVSGTETTARLYACPNVFTKTSIVHADRNTHGFMRAPPETPYAFALESALDELALAAGLDPVELRRRNDTVRDPIKGVPYSSRSLMACYDAAAQAFGWKERDPRAASMREGEWLIGWGCASAFYPSRIGAAAARLTLEPDGHARLQTAAIDIGTGTETILAGLVADRLGISIDGVDVQLGDTEWPPAGLAAGSIHAATVCNVAARACDDIRARLIGAAVTSNEGRFAGMRPSDVIFADGEMRGSNGVREKLTDAIARVTPGALEVYVENTPPGAAADSIKKLYVGQPSFVSYEDNLRSAFGAQFAEVRVHERTREIRVPRMVGAFAAGTIVNPMTAKSQLMGGMIWGMSAALLEETEIDRRQARYTNTNLADYLVPVNADVPSVEVILVPETDDIVNPLGIKGVGELGIVGMNAAIANAVYHATGKRIRELPIRIEALLP